jgi:hypothetical protein
MSLRVALRALRVGSRSAVASRKRNTALLQQAARSAVESLEGRLLFATWHVWASLELEQGIADNTNTGILTLHNQVYGDGGVSTDVTADTWQQAAIAAVSSVNVTSSPSGGGTPSTYTDITDSSHFEAVYASQTGHTQPANEPALSEPNPATGTSGLDNSQQVIAFEDGTDADFNDGYFSVTVTSTEHRQWL